MNRKPSSSLVEDQPAVKTRALELRSPVADQAPGARLWRNRNFNIFWLGQTLSVCGDAFATIAIPLLVLEATGSVAQMGMVTAVFGVSQIITGIFAGWLTDRLDRRKLMIFCDTLRTLLYATIPLGWWLSGPHLWLIYVVVALGSSLGMVFQVTYITAITNLVDPDQINEANGRLQTTLAISSIVGPILAGVVSGAFGPSVAIAADALSFAISAISITLIRLRPVASVSPAELLRAENPELAVIPQDVQSRQRFKEEFLAGVRFLWKQPVLRWLTILLFSMGLISSGTMVLFIFHLKHDLGQSDSMVGVVLGVASLGSMMAGLLTPMLRRRLGFGICWISGFIVLFIMIALIGLDTNLWLIGLFAVIYTFTSTLTSVVSVALRQQITPDYLLGRVTSAFWTLIAAPAPIGAAVLTALAGQIGSAPVLCVMGLSGVLITAVALFTPVRQHSPERRYQAGGILQDER